MNYATHIGYSDREAFEVLSAKGNALVIRQLDATLDPSWKPEIVAGGFAGHCTNNHTQRYAFASNESNPTITVRLCQAKVSSASRRRGSYYSKHGAEFRLSEIPVQFHDYNF